MLTRQPAGPKTVLCHAMTNKWWVKKREKGKLINAATHANFLLRVNNTIVVQQGVLAYMAEVDCFGKSTT